MFLNRGCGILNGIDSSMRGRRFITAALVKRIFAIRFLDLLKLKATESGEKLSFTVPALTRFELHDILLPKVSNN